MNKAPLARSSEVVIQELGSDILIYDLKTHKAYSLNETSTIIYQACNGKTTFDDLKKKHPKLTDEIILLAISELERVNLLVEKWEAKFERREILRKAAFSALALPLIVALNVPRSAQAASCQGMVNLVIWIFPGCCSSVCVNPGLGNTHTVCRRRWL